VNSVDSSIVSTFKSVFDFDQFRDGQAKITTRIPEEFGGLWVGLRAAERGI
jgi:hypothetical protein